MEWKEIKFDLSEGVATVSLNRPEYYNALTPVLCRELSQAMEQCSADQSVRAVVVTGIGKAFCAGGDLRTFRDNLEDVGQVLVGMVDDLNRMTIAIRRMPKPVIAAVNGATGGAGMSLAAVCDLRVAAQGAKFRQAYTSNGISPDAGWSAFVPHLIGLGRASELLLLDPVLSAVQACQYGLVNQVVPEGEALPTAQAWARELAAGPTQSYASAKRLLNASLLPNLEAQLEKEREGIVFINTTRDFREGVQAFLEKRNPLFVGA